MVKKVLVCLISFLLLSSTLGPVNAADLPRASDGQINEAMTKIVPLRILPSNPFYFLIVGKETVLRVFQPSSAKRTEYDLVLSGKRLKESYLLLLRDNEKDASENMTRYTQRMRMMIEGMEKARAQKQDITNIVSEIAENLKSHEALLFAIQKKESGNNKYNFGANYQAAVAVFVDAVWAINKFQPGISDRFKSATESAKPEIDNSPKSPGFIEASPGSQPSRIIY